MSIVKIDTSSDDIFKPVSFEPIKPGVYLCSIKNLPSVCGDSIEPKKQFTVQMSSKDTQIIPVQLVIESAVDGSETDMKGKTVFDNLPLEHPFGQQKLVHLALSVGAMTEDEIKASGGQIDLARFLPGQRGAVEIGIKMQKPYDNPDGEPEPRNVVKRYLWE